MQDMTDFINQVKRANDIVDVIGNSLELRRSGANFVARCPFHGERTPSFHVNRNKQIFKCFGCGEAGDVIGFVQKYESCSFMEALEILVAFIQAYVFTMLSAVFIGLSRVKEHKAD